MIDTKDILKISAYFSKIHHTSGRLRVKINSAIIKDVKNVSLSDITQLPNQIDGLKEIKINKIMATATIIYDSLIFPQKIWDDLIAGENLDEVVEVLNSLESKIKESKR